MQYSTLSNYMFRLNDRIEQQNNHYASVGCDEQLEYFNFQTVQGCKLIEQELENDSEDENVYEDGEATQSEIAHKRRYYAAVEIELKTALKMAEKSEKKFVTKTA